MSLRARHEARKSAPKSGLQERAELRKRVQAGRDATNAQMDALDPTKGMSTYEKTMAGVGGGMLDVAQGLGNMVGLVDDEEVAAKKATDAALADTTAGSVGQMIGEGVALLPLGLAGGGLAAAGASKVAPQALKFLPKAVQTLAPRIAGGATAATLEGGAGGAVLANPNERGRGAAKGAATGLLLNRSLAGLSRVGKDGLAKVTPSANRLMDVVEGKLGRRPHIPLGQAVDIGADASSAKAGAYADFASLLPSAKAKMETQAKNLADDVYETNLRQVFGGNKSKVASKVFRETGDMQMALDAGKNASKSKIKEFTPTQEILQEAAAGSKRGMYTPKRLIKASERLGVEAGRDVSDSSMRPMANTMDDVMSRSTGNYTVDAKDAYRTLSSSIGAIADKVPGLGSFVGSQRVQRFLMGNTGWQKKLQRAVDSSNGQLVRGTMSDIRRAMSVQPAVQEDSGINSIPGRANEAAEYLRSM